MNEHALRVLEYDKILARLAAGAGSPLGRSLAEGLRPMTDRVLIDLALAATGEAERVLTSADGFALGEVHDIRPEIERARVGGTLNPHELLRVGATITAGRLMKEYFADRAEDYPTLAGMAEACGSFRRIESDLQKALGPEGEIQDDASPELRRLRNHQRTLHNRIHDKLDSMIRSGETQRYLQEALVTQRGERYVLPVKQEYRSMVQGIVHDQSASGATLFVEPLAVVELNNQLRAAEAAEQEEIERILAVLSAAVGQEAAAILRTLTALGELDFALAKGRLSLAYNCRAPEINDECRIELRRARHPLLAGDVVPIDVSLGREFTAMVITGPNTGGKTVALKTIGLTALMAQSGLHIPAGSGSTVGIFTEIACDIGDEQSIEQSLSTFSSHLTQIVRLMRTADSPQSLVLLDELGAGTDPAEGAALAMALLESLHARGVRIAATTHYSELKTFAYQTPGMTNAAVEFDLATLRPTYRLMVGLPGRSNAFAIAARLGLDPEIIARAESLLKNEDRRFEEIIGSITDDARAARDARCRAEDAQQRAERLRREYEQGLRQLREEKNEILRAARREARELLSETRREAENLLREMQEADGEEERRRAARELRSHIQTKLRQHKEEMPETPGATAGEPPADLRPGETVHCRGLDQEGIVLSVNNDLVQVQVGQVKVSIPPAGLTRVLQPARPAGGASGHGALGQAKALTVQSELDLRGMRVEEALTAVDKYLDDLCLVGMSRARIIHGKGTGALRAAIADLLRDHPRVKAYRTGLPNEGGAGVTVVEMTI